MSKRELARVEVQARVRSKQLRVVDAGRLMQVSYRQAKRLWKRYREEGAAGLQHRSAGRPSNHGHGKKFRQQVLQLVREKYGGAVGERFGPTLAAEHLAAEDGLQVDAETLRRWMLTEGLWSRERKRRRHRRRRDRKEHFGEMVQIDMVDDATNKTWAQLGEQETIWAVADALRAWIERYGVPQALYVDWKNLYKRPANAGERLRGEEPVTQFGRMCAKLGITLITANSPQAKGRVERQHGTHQDRLVKKLRRRGIYSYEGSNVFLEREYLPEHNQRFARAAARPEDYHRKAPCAAELERIFRLESERTVSDDWVVRYDNRFFQLEPQSGHIVTARSKVWVCEGRHGRMSIESGGRALRWREIAAPVQPQGLETAARPATLRVPISVKKRKWTPPPSHPWHEPPRPKVQKRARRLAASSPRPSLAWPYASP
jgi:transposase